MFINLIYEISKSKPTRTSKINFIKNEYNTFWWINIMTKKTCKIVTGIHT